MKKTFDDNPLHHDSVLPERAKRRRRKKKEDSTGFLEQDVNLAQSILFPDGYENLMLGIYFITVPYIAGLLFIFFYIGSGDTDVFLSLNDDKSFLITWAIGYEVVASLILLWIAKLGLSSFFAAGRNRGHEKFQIP